MYRTINLRTALLGAASLFALAGAPVSAVAAPAAATTPATVTTVPDIIVTAEKRETTLQKTPLAISAVTASQLQVQHVKTMADVAENLPNVEIGQLNSQAEISIRGLSTDYLSFGNEARVAYYLDGVYISRPSAVLATFFDVDRIEVVRGPQGVLYGRNATGGAVNVITANPTATPTGFLTVDVGNYGTVNTDGALAGPIANNIGARFAFQTQDHGGYGYDPISRTPVDNHHSAAARLKLKFDPTPTWSVVLSGDYFHEKDNAYGQMLVGETGVPGVPLAGVARGGYALVGRDQAGYYPMKSYRSYYGIMADVHGQIGSVDVRSITGYRNTVTQGQFDDAFTSLPLIDYTYDEKSSSVSEELRFSGDVGRLSWLGGGYYFHEQIYTAKVAGISGNLISRARPLLPLTEGSINDGYLTTNAYAGFGKLTFRIFRELSLEAGGRYSIEDKAVNQAGGTDLTDSFIESWSFPTLTQYPKIAHSAGSVHESAFDPQVTLSYTPAPGKLLYFTFSEGFKSGGWNIGFNQAPYRPESIIDEEGGIKATWLDGRLATNLSLFNYDYTNMQVTTVLLPAGAVVPVSAIQNAAKSRIRGLEAEVTFVPVTGFEVHGSLALLDAKYVDYKSIDTSRASLGVLNLSGNTLYQAPPYKVTVAPQYTWRPGWGDVTLRGEAIWTGLTYFSAYNVPTTSQPAYAMFNASVSYTTESGRWMLTAYVRNITNKLVLASAYIGSAIQGYPVDGNYQAPRLYGVSLTGRF